MLKADRPLSAEAMTRAMDAMMTSAMPAEDVRTLLISLARRGETAEEIAAAVAALRAHAVPLPLSRSYELCDTCGTGGDGQGTFNISTLAALVASTAGVRIAKHGNRAASGRCGSADLFEALGVHLAASPAAVARCIEELGFGFCFAPHFHPAMKAVSPIRKALGIRTLFNLIGPLANPAPLTFQLVGVSEARLLRPMAEALVRLGIRHGMVVHGRDGLDEVTTTAMTDGLEVQSGHIGEFRFDPADWGLPSATIQELRGGDVPRNAAMAREVLSDARTAARAIVAVNAGCAIYLADQARTVPDGIEAANQAISSGRALEVLATGAPLRLLQQVEALSHAD